MLLGKDPSSKELGPLPYDKPDIAFAYAKHIWDQGEKANSLNLLCHLVENCLKQAQVVALAESGNYNQPELMQLKAK
jgi:hypothetical protein